MVFFYVKIANTSPIMFYRFIEKTNKTQNCHFSQQQSYTCTIYLDHIYIFQFIISYRNGDGRTDTYYIILNSQVFNKFQQ